MGLFKRVGDILSANVNDLVERFESPETMLRQAIREMDEAVARQMESTARAIADERIIDKELHRLREQAAARHHEARAAVGRGDDDAARRALSQRHEVEKLITVLEVQRTEVRTTSERLRHELDAMRIRRREAEHIWRTLIALNNSAQARKQLAGANTVPSGDQTGFAKFERWQQTIERDEVETTALLELNGVREELDEFTSTSARAVDAELLALKQERH